VLPVLTRDEMRAADAAALAERLHETLVNRAGTAVAHAALRMLGGAYGRRVTVVAGKGSNGADGRSGRRSVGPTGRPGHHDRSHRRPGDAPRM
jgi:NAD(P)H-hydrate repair Nnr-like enzyme with NAD(P)H-hydrate epimerase domain